MLRGNPAAKDGLNVSKSADVDNVILNQRERDYGWLTGGSVSIRCISSFAAELPGSS